MNHTIYEKTMSMGSLFESILSKEDYSTNISKLKLLEGRACNSLFISFSPRTSYYTSGNSPFAVLLSSVFRCHFSKSARLRWTLAEASQILLTVTCRFGVHHQSSEMTGYESQLEQRHLGSQQSAIGWSPYGPECGNPGLPVILTVILSRQARPCP